MSDEEAAAAVVTETGDDAVMKRDEQEQEGYEEDDELVQEPVKKVEKIVVLSALSNDPSKAATFEIRNEDHTLGNALRFNAMQDPNVTMSAYNVPHPLETKMHLRIETKPDIAVTPTQALRTALDRTIAQCDDLMRTFNKEFKAVAQ